MPSSDATLFAPATADAPARLCLIAELGVNHDGSLARALELARDAARAGADAIKLQLFDPRHLLSNQAAFAEYQKTGRAGAADVFSMLDRLKLKPADMARVADTARGLGLKFIATPFSLEDVPVLAEIGVDALKIASPDAVNTPLLQAAAALGKPLLISTGTCDEHELLLAANLVRRTGGCLLQCVSSYPTAETDAAIGGVTALARAFEVPVGYSDHTVLVRTGALAVAAGACVLEKHFTYNRDAEGPDHAAKLDADDFAEYANRARQAAQMLGPIVKAVRPVERDVRQVSRQSVCLCRDLPAGHELTRADLTVKRPAPPWAIPAARFDQILGRRLARPVQANDLLKDADLV